MEDKKRAILNMVAEGRLSPQEAADMLEDVASTEVPVASEPAATAVAPRAPQAVVPVTERVAPPPRPPLPPPAAEATPPGAVAGRIRINANLGSATIVGDPDVREVYVDGPHNIRREGDTLVVESEPFSGRGFFFEGDSARTWGRKPNTLHARVNPDIELWLAVTAGSVHVRNINAPLHATAAAGSVTIEGFRGPIDLTTQAGSVRARGRLDRGTSTIRCEAGSVRIGLERGSSVAVSAHSSMGQVRVEGARQPGRHRGRVERLVIGEGAGTLDIENTMGSVRIEVEE